MLVIIATLSTAIAAVAKTQNSIQSTVKDIADSQLRLKKAQVDLEKKIEKILEWESQGIYFSPDRTRSILTSTAPPGTSQHLALLAFDVVEFRNPPVRATLNKNGWFQTIVDDPAHFTYLGLPESELPGRGLIAVAKGGHQYWIPHLPSRAVGAVYESSAVIE